jgi:hypothetical protein
VDRFAETDLEKEGRVEDLMKRLEETVDTPVLSSLLI